jgi:hypothetical protein
MQAKRIISGSSLSRETAPALSKTGAAIPMRQVRGATMTGAAINAPRLLPVPSRRFTPGL